MSAALLALATQVGAPLVRRVLSDRIGGGNARLVEGVVTAIAERVGVSPDDLPGFAEQNPDMVRSAIEEVEATAPDLVQVYMAEAATREALLMAEASQGGWRSAWRPGWMILLGFFWFWQVIGLHVLNAIFKIALPMVPWEYLMGVTALFLGLYMGGHTVKDVAKSFVRRA